VTPRLDIGKVLMGAFLVPCWHRRSFLRALGIPLALLATLTLTWHYAGRDLPAAAGWAVCVVWVVFFTLFAVTCHRLVLLDAEAVSKRLRPEWSRREMLFLLWLAGVWFIAAAAFMFVMTIAANVSLWTLGPDQDWLDWLTYLAKIPAAYLFARLCMVFPATALDRRADWRWAWQLTRNNGWRLFVVVAILPWAISQLLALLYRAEATVIETILLSVTGIALFAVEIAAISLSYRELTREGQQQ
jgi:hypothetical protein